MISYSKNLFFFAKIFLSLLVFSPAIITAQDDLSPKVGHFLTFIMPCYNCAATVKESLDSIYQQHNLTIPFEVVCTDDGSSDKTREILLEEQKQHTNMHVVFHEKNQGGAATRNTCVNNSQGDLIFCLDSDNILTSNSVMGLVELLDKSGCEGAAFGEMKFFKGNFIYSHTGYLKAPNNIFDIRRVFVYAGVPGFSGNYLYTRESFDRAGGYPIYSSAMDTWGFSFRQHATGTNIAILPNTFYWHRDEGNGYWRREAKKNIFDNICCKIALEYPELFTAETYDYLVSGLSSNIDFFEQRKNNRYKLVSEPMLTSVVLKYKSKQKSK